MNIPRGEVVPESGNFECTNCIVAHSIIDVFAAKSGMDRTHVPTKGGSTVRYFEKGTIFPDCPHCGHLTGWCITDKNAGQVNEPSGVQQALSKLMQASKQCDICGEYADWSSYKVVEPVLVVKATSAGYFPGRLPASWKPECDMLGISAVSHWAAVVKMNSSKDWILCTRCLEEVLVHQPRKQWWEFWK